MKQTRNTTELRKKIYTLVLDCLITGEAERTAEKVMYGDPNYWVDEIMKLFKEEREAVLQEVEKELTTVRKDVPWKEATNDYNRYLRGRGERNMIRIEKPGQYILYRGALCEVVGIGEGKSIHLKVLKDEQKNRCPHCDKPIETEINVLENSPLFQGNTVLLTEQTQ